MDSRGTVPIGSPDPEAHPAIVANYLAAETDRRAIIDGLLLACRPTRESRRPSEAAPILIH